MTNRVNVSMHFGDNILAQVCHFVTLRICTSDLHCRHTIFCTHENEGKTNGRTKERNKTFAHHPTFCRVLTIDCCACRSFGDDSECSAVRRDRFKANYYAVYEFVQKEQGGIGTGIGPGSNPGIGPGRDPGIGPGRDPGIGPGRDPGIGPGRDPKIGSGRDPGIGPGRDPKIGSGRDLEKANFCGQKVIQAKHFKEQRILNETRYAKAQ